MKGKEQNERPTIQPDELLIIRECIRDGDVVFDVGAYHGEWSIHVKQEAENCSFHLFEAAPDAFRQLASGPFSNEVVNKIAVTDQSGELMFHVYRDKPMLSAIDRRLSVENSLLPAGFDSYLTPSVCLDDYWPASSGLINFLKIDVEGAEYDVLRGANNLLCRGAIDYLQFEYGGTFADSRTTLKSVFYLLQRHQYHLFRVVEQQFEYVDQFSDSLENYQYANYLAVNERHLSRFQKDKPCIPLYFEEIASLGVEVTGVVHLGAHRGDEVMDYLDKELDPIVLVEANPVYTNMLRERYGDETNVVVAETAISDRSGTGVFNIASSDQSSSLLNLGTHADIYPNIKFTEQIMVQLQTLDNCLRACVPEEHKRERINLLVMDIQGAEILALRGGATTLNHIDAIQLEVNYEEVYEGCASVWELDEFLGYRGFTRYKTTCPFHRSWGDALYVRRPLVANSTIGTLGRFGNHFFQFLFLKSHALDMGYRYENTSWDGDLIFNVSQGKSGVGEGLRLVEQTLYSTEDCHILNGADRLANSDLRGFFQYSTRVHRRRRDAIRDTFTFRGEYQERAQRIRHLFAERKTTVVGLHIRRGDYGNRWFFIAPTKWYVSWLSSLQDPESQFVIYLASDDLDLVLPDFAAFNIMTRRDLPEPGISSPEFFDDFAALTLCDKLAISNSSFSFAASMLNVHADEFLRPDLGAGGLVSFDPWSAEPLLRNELAEDYGEEFTRTGQPG